MGKMKTAKPKGVLDRIETPPITAPFNVMIGSNTMATVELGEDKKIRKIVNHYDIYSNRTREFTAEFASDGNVVKVEGKGDAANAAEAHAAVMATMVKFGHDWIPMQQKRMINEEETKQKRRAQLKGLKAE